MTWSLGLTADGDLALGSHGFVQVSNEQKLVQDLRCELLEPKNTNKFYPNYGSKLDENLIGEVITNQEDLGLQIESEIADVINRYKNRQFVRAKADKMTFGKATLTRREVLIDFSITRLEQNEGAANVEINLTTAKTNPGGAPITLLLSM